MKNRLTPDPTFLEMAQSLVEELQRQIVVLRAERDEARRCVRELSEAYARLVDPRDGPPPRDKPRASSPPDDAVTGGSPDTRTPEPDTESGRRVTTTGQPFRFAVRRCDMPGCLTSFQPSGPRSRYCAVHRDKNVRARLNAARPTTVSEGVELETVWAGGEGLTGHRGGSSLGS